MAAGGLDERVQDVVVFQAHLAARAQQDFAVDHNGAQTLLGVVVGRRDVGFAQAGKAERLFGAQQALPKRFDRRPADRLQAQLVEFCPQDFFLRQRLAGTQFPVRQSVRGLAKSLANLATLRRCSLSNCQ